MVFQKKGATPGRKPQAKKKGKQVFEAENDNDSDMFNELGDSDDLEEMVVQKTPQNKTPKGQNSQSMSGRKVSFELSGKKTPGKTPQKNNSSPVKKQATRMMGNKVQQKKQPQGEEEDDDDEDDDDEDDDFELDMDDIDMEDDDDDGGDDDEDEDDDEEDDEDDEEDDEEEEQKTTQKQNKSNSKLQKNDVKNVEQNSKAKTPKIETKEKPITKTQVESLQAEEDRRRERDLKSLFVGNLPTDATVNELKGLSPDIESVTMPSKRLNKPTRFAFLMFSSVAKAESNYKTLQNKKLRGESLSIDFVGEKSQKKHSAKILDKVPKKAYNLKRLYIPAVPHDATVADIAIHFPKAFQVTVFSSPVSGSANIDFREEDAAAEGFKLREIEVNGQKLMVYHSLAAPLKKKKGPHKRLGKPHRGAQPPAKKMKVQKGKKDE